MTPDELAEKVCTIPTVYVDWMFRELRAMKIGESLSPSKEKNRENFILIGKYAIQFECFRHLGWDFLFSNDFSVIRKTSLISEGKKFAEIKAMTHQQQNEYIKWLELKFPIK